MWYLYLLFNSVVCALLVLLVLFIHYDLICMFCYCGIAVFWFVFEFLNLR